MLDVWDLVTILRSANTVVLGENKSDLADSLSVLLMVETLDYLKTYM